MRGSVQVSAGQGGVLASTNKLTECWMGFEWAGTEEVKGALPKPSARFSSGPLGILAAAFASKRTAAPLLEMYLQKPGPLVGGMSPVTATKHRSVLADKQL